MEIYLKIGSLMEKHNLTNQALADLSGVPIGTISGIRSGKIASPSFDAICAILRVMDEPVDALLDVPSSHQGAPDAIKRSNADAQQQAILKQTATVAAQAATLEAQSANIDSYKHQINALNAELRFERRRSLRQQMALVALVVAIIALAAVYIWDVRNLHSGLTAYFNP